MAKEFTGKKRLLVEGWLGGVNRLKPQLLKIVD